MKVSEIFALYGTDLLTLLEATQNRIKLVRKYLITGDKVSSIDRFILWEINDTLQSLDLSHERLSDALFSSRKESDQSIRENKFFLFDDNGEVRTISQEEAAEIGMLDEGEERYENDDF